MVVKCSSTPVAPAVAKLDCTPKKASELADISTEDLGEACAYEVGMKRELAEEINIDTKYAQQMVGLINDDSNDVGKVHLGVVHLFTVDQPKVHSQELEIAGAGFEPIESMLQDIERYETWSQFCIKALFG